MLCRSLTTGLAPAAVLLLGLGATARARGPAIAAQDDLQDQVRALAQGALLGDAVRGITVVVSLDGETLASVGEGIAGCDPEAADARTRFAAGGCMDLFLGLAAARMAERGDLDLDADVASLLEDFPFEGEEVSVRQLLSHTSGIPSLGDLPVKDARAAGAQDDPEVALLERLGALPMAAAPGSCQEYSSGGVLVLGLVLRSVSETDVPTLIRKEVLAPMGLSDTDFEGPESAADTHFLRYLGAELVGAEPQPLPFQADQLRTTAADLTTLANGLASSELEDLLDILTEAVEIDDRPHLFAQGVVTGDFEGHDFFSFGGSSDSCAIQCAFYPDLQLSIAVCASTGEAPVERLERRIARLVYGLPEPGILDMPLPDSAEATYAGEFLVGCNSHFITVNNGRLRLSVPEGTAFDLLFQGDHQFVSSVDPDVRLVFQVENDVAQEFFLEEHGARSIGKRIQ